MNKQKISLTLNILKLIMFFVLIGFAFVQHDIMLTLIVWVLFIDYKLNCVESKLSTIQMEKTNE
jgi:energy-coupling factor transporter transmembrane protein EcfT